MWILKLIVKPKRKTIRNKIYLDIYVSILVSIDFLLLRKTYYNILVHIAKVPPSTSLNHHKRTQYFTYIHSFILIYVPNSDRQTKKGLINCVFQVHIKTRICGMIVFKSVGSINSNKTLFTAYKKFEFVNSLLCYQKKNRMLF